MTVPPAEFERCLCVDLA